MAYRASWSYLENAIIHGADQDFLAIACYCGLACAERRNIDIHFRPTRGASRQNHQCRNPHH